MRLAISPTETLTDLTTDLVVANNNMAGEVESLDLRSSRALIFSNVSVGTGFVLSQCRPEGIWCDAALRIMACKIVSPFWQLVGSGILLSLFYISLLYRTQFALFKLMLE